MKDRNWRSCSGIPKAYRGFHRTPSLTKETQ
jgi:hypothetical protein